MSIHNELLEVIRFAGKVALNVLNVVIGRYIDVLHPSLKRFGLPTIKVCSNPRGLSVSLDDRPESVDERIAKIARAR